MRAARRGNHVAAQMNRNRGAWCAGTDPGIPCRAAGARLGQQQHQTQQDEYACQHASRRPVEGDLKLLEDRDGEGVEPDHGEGAVLGEQMDTDQQATAQDRQPQLRQHHAEEHTRRVGSEGAGRFLDGRIEPAQRRGHGQIHEREVRQRGDQHACPQSMKGRNHPDPGIAVHEGRNRQRRNEQRTPDCAAGQVGPLHQPGHRDPDDHAQRHRDDDQRDGVDQQLADPWPDHQFERPVPPDRHRPPHHVPERNGRGGDKNRDRCRNQRAGTGRRLRPRNRCRGQ